MRTQTVEVRFDEELVRSLVAEDGTAYALYRTPEGLYKVHIDEGARAWLEAGIGDGLEERQARRLWPELFAAG